MALYLRGGPVRGRMDLHGWHGRVPEVCFCYFGADGLGSTEFISTDRCFAVMMPESA